MMACHGLCAKTFSEPVLASCEMIHWEQISVKLESKYNIFYTEKWIKKYCLQRGGNFVVDSIS